jgi:hypothetical protein
MAGAFLENVEILHMVVGGESWRDKEYKQGAR